MPCPFFEPQHLIENRAHTGARFPLIREYGGLCHAHEGQPVTAPSERRFDCNHGYSRDTCPHFPARESPSAVRYSVTQESTEKLDLLCIEEAGYAPLQWHALRYETAGDRLEPGPVSRCVEAQALAFCRGYLQLSKILNVNE